MRHVASSFAKFEWMSQSDPGRPGHFVCLREMKLRELVNGSSRESVRGRCWAGSLIHKTAGREDQYAGCVSPHDEFSDVETSHDCLSGVGSSASRVRLEIFGERRGSGFSCYTQPDGPSPTRRTRKRLSGTIPPAVVWRLFTKEIDRDSARAQIKGITVLITSWSRVRAPRQRRVGTVQVNRLLWENRACGHKSIGRFTSAT